MLELTGSKTSCKIYNDYVEESAIQQIYSFLNHPVFENKKTRFMSDVHYGSGAVIGTTVELGDKVIPNVIGVDISCGVTMWKLNYKIIDFKKLYDIINEYVPSGRNVRKHNISLNIQRSIFSTLNLDISFTEWKEKLDSIAKKVGCSNHNQSLGTLGGGNHYIEINEADGIHYLNIHSGSRNLGLRTAKFHQQKAINFCKYGNSRMEDAKNKIIEKYKKKNPKLINQKLEELKRENSISVPNGMEYLEGSEAQLYYDDMYIINIYALMNRRFMAYMIMNIYFGDYYNSFSEIIESTHNYIDFKRKIIRKGAISAELNESVVIPINMAFGIIIGKGTGNEDANYSAPHGAGRLMSRSKAKEELTVEEFEKQMSDAGVVSYSINKNTLDEAPMAYKNPDDIIFYLEENNLVKDIKIAKPVFNFKAGE